MDLHHIPFRGPTAFSVTFKRRREDLHPNPEGSNRLPTDARTLVEFLILGDWIPAPRPSSAPFIQGAESRGKRVAVRTQQPQIAG